MPENSCPSTTEARARPSGRLAKNGASTFAACMVLVAEVFAQPSGGSPWTPAVRALQVAFTGPFATGLAVVAMVVGGPMCAFAESATQRTLAGVICGMGMAIGAVNFMAWVFP